MPQTVVSHYSQPSPPRANEWGSVTLRNINQKESMPGGSMVNLDLCPLPPSRALPRPKLQLLRK